MGRHNHYGKCAYSEWNEPPRLDDTPCPECLAEERGDAMRDEQKDPDWGSDIDEEPRRCGLDN